MPRTAVIGVGNLGRPIAERMLATGWPVAVLDTDPAAVGPLVARGAQACATPAEVARSADVILLVVRTAVDVENVLFGPSGIAGAAGPDALICIVATIALDDLQRIAAQAAAVSLAVVDAAIGGGSPAAARGDAAAMIGGTQAQYERTSAVFGAFCGDMIHVPGVGGGMRLKLIKNHLSYTTMMVGLEAAALARAADIELPLVRRVIGSSNLVDQFFFRYLDRGDIDPLPADAPADEVATQLAMAGLCEKDLSAARDLAALRGVDLPIAAAVAERARRLFRVPGSDAPVPATA